MDRQLKEKKTGPLRAALYMRVSSHAQAKNELSIPDQRKKLRAFSAVRDWIVVAEFKDARTGRDDNRPEFQRMMDAALYDEDPFDVIVVHSYSRFFRNQLELGLRTRALEKRGIRLVSITQEVGDDPAGNLLRQILALFDEYNSLETGKHVARTLAENARQGFFNGGPAPFGFEAVAAEKRGKTIKKKLVLKEDEAEIARLVFGLYLRGDGSSGPMGVKKITEWLNDHGGRTRQGARWGIGPIHRMLTDPIYKGDYWRNRDSEASEPILISVPAIVSTDSFDQVQRTLKSKNPKKAPPRLVGSPVLLSGLATCATCGSGMILGTGKSGRYRYYVCGGRVRQGKGTCEGRRVRMAETDKIAIDAVLADLINHRKMYELLQELAEKKDRKEARQRERLAEHELALSDTKARLSRLLQLVEDGVMESSDPDLAERLQELRGQRGIAERAVITARSELGPQAEITARAISDFVELMRKNLASGEVSLRQAYLRAIIDEIEIGDDEIYVRGRKERVKQAVGAQHSLPAAVPTFVRRWRRERAWRRTLSDT